MDVRITAFKAQVIVQLGLKKAEKKNTKDEIKKQTANRDLLC